MAKQPFVTTQPVPLSWFNAIGNLLKFNKNPGEELFDGEYYRLEDDALSNDPSAIKNRVNTFFDELKVSAGTGLSITYTGGSVDLLNGSRQTIAPGTLPLTDNATNFIYSLGGVVATSTTLPLKGFLMASVVTSGGSIVSVSDRRRRFAETPLGNLIRLFGGSGDEGDLTVPNGGSVTLSQSEYYYRNLTVNSTGVVTVPSGVTINCAGNVTINGTVTVQQAIAGAAARSAVINSGTATVDGRDGSGQGQGSGFSGGSSYLYSISRVGSGGGSGRMSLSGTPSSGTTSGGGRGGGFIEIFAAGTITIATGGVISAIGANGIAPISTSGTVLATGGGGGSGGLILLRSLSGIIIQAGATLTVAGGAGSNSIGAGYGGGGGGGGGYIVLLSPTTNNSGTIVLTGGAAGTASATQEAGGGGGAFAGNGGHVSASTMQPGSSGSLVVRNFLPVG